MRLIETINENELILADELAELGETWVDNAENCAKQADRNGEDIGIKDVCLLSIAASLASISKLHVARARQGYNAAVEENERRISRELDD